MREKKSSRIISFISASSNSGKTTLIEKLVPLLKARGQRVAVIKHASAGFELDKPGKDSRRFQQAGADSVVLAGPDRLALMKKVEDEPSVEELERLAGDVDIIVYEGFKKSAKNKIEVFRSGVSGEHPLCKDDPSYLALVSDASVDFPVLRFDLNDAEGVAQYIMTNI